MGHMSRRGVLALGLGLLASRAHAQAAPAADFPTRPIRMVVSTSAGGGIDVLARAYAEKLQAILGQPVVVEAKPGANGMIAAQTVTGSPADGHTLLFTNSGLMQNTHLKPVVGARVTDLAPVTLLALAPPTLGIQTSIPAKGIDEFVALVKSNPGKYSFGSTGTGSAAHLLGEMLNKARGLDLAHVPYKGESAAMVDFLGNQLSAVFSAPGSMMRQAQGRMRLLAVASPQRLKAFPDLPTFSEVGLPEMNLPGFAAVFAPANTPAPIVDRLSDALLKIARMPDIEERMLTTGFELGALGAKEFGVRLKTENDSWRQVIERTAVRLD